MTPPPFDPTTTIITPSNAWCRRHWQEIDADQTINSVFAGLRLITRTLELDRFVDKCYPPEGHKAATDVARINEVLREISPVCCWLGDEEMSLLRGEARSIGERRS